MFEAGFLARGRRESGFGGCRLARLALLLVFHTDRRAHGETGEENKRNSEWTEFIASSTS